eukprot:1454072-Pyramimonas_sp.AAC.1
MRSWGPVEIPAFLHCWRGVAVPPGGAHNKELPSDADVAAWVARHGADFAREHGLDAPPG